MIEVSSILSTQASYKLLFVAQPDHWYPVASIFCKYASYRGLLGTNSIFKKCFVVDKILIGKNLTKLKAQLSG